jgi:hypothetical protein
MPQDLHTDTDMYSDLLLMVAINVMIFYNSRKVLVIDYVLKDYNSFYCCLLSRTDIKGHIVLHLINLSISKISLGTVT